MGTMASGVWRGRKWDFLIALHGKQPPDQREWEAYCQRQAEAESPERVRGLTLTLGAGPNRRQRVQLVEIHRRAGAPASAPASVITDSALVRGIIATFTWIGLVQGVRMFSLCELHDALDYVGVEPEEKEELLAALEQLGEGIDDGNPIRFALELARRRSQPARSVREAPSAVRAAGRALAQREGDRPPQAQRPDHR
jgi:hypothetical protein